MLITLEGLDGSGKTTAAKSLHEFLIQKGFRVFLTKEPSDEFKKMIESGNRNKLSTLLLFLADRAEHAMEMQRFMNQSEGNVVICDRYIHSTFAYQFDVAPSDAHLLQLINISANNVLPDYTLYFDIDKKTAIERLQNRETGELDKKALKHAHIILERYKTLINFDYKKSPQFKIIDARKTLEEVNVQVKNIVYQVLKDREMETFKMYHRKRTLSHH